MKQSQWQSEHHQAQQETPRTQNQAYRKSPHRLHVQAQFRGQAHRHKANRPNQRLSVTHSLILRQRQSRQHQRLQLQRQARLQGVPNQKLRQQKRIRQQKQTARLQLPKTRRHHL